MLDRQERTVPDNVVAIGLLPASDLERLGQSFRRHFPVQNDNLFDELLAKLDRLPPVNHKGRNQAE